MNNKLDLKMFKKFGDFKLSSGLQSKVYYDLKEAMGEPKLLQQMITNLMKDIVVKPDLIIGIDFGGIPLAVGLSLKMKIPFAILRKFRNKHGMAKRIEGCQKKGTVLLVDDVYNTGMSTNNAETYLTYCGYKVLQTITLLQRDLAGNLK